MCISPANATNTERNENASASPALGTIYFVDFENVHSQGLIGAKSLADVDRVFVFYTDNARSVDIDVLRHLEKTKAAMEWLKTVSKEQGADKAILARLGFEVGRHNATKYVVVSCDGGFSSMINMLRNLSNADIELQKTVAPSAEPAKQTPELSETNASPSPTELKLLGLSTDSKPAPTPDKTSANEEPDVAPRLIREALQACKIEASKIEAAVAKYRECLKHDSQSTAVNNALMTCLPTSQVKTVYATIKPQLK